MGTGRKPPVETLAALRWRKARASNNEGACVRAAHHGGHVLIDDSKSPSSVSRCALVLTPAAWHSLLRTVR